MLHINIRQLIDLVASGCPDPESRLEKLFDWYHARQLELVKATFTAALALFVPVVVSFFKDELSKGLSRWWLIAAVFGSVALALIALGMLLRVRHAYGAYLSAQSLMGEVRKISPFLERYRNQVERRWR